MDDYPLIQFKNTVKRLGDNSVLDGINLSIYRGEITSIIGKSGTGKSVLLKHIIGLIEPESGQVVFEDKPISRMNNSARKVFKQKISYMSLHPLKQRA